MMLSYSCPIAGCWSPLPESLVTADIPVFASATPVGMRPNAMSARPPTHEGPPRCSDGKLGFGEPCFLGSRVLGSGNRSKSGQFSASGGHFLVKMMPQVFADFCVRGGVGLLCGLWLGALGSPDASGNSQGRDEAALGHTAVHKEAWDGVLSSPGYHCPGLLEQSPTNRGLQTAEADSLSVCRLEVQNPVSSLWRLREAPSHLCWLWGLQASLRPLFRGHVAAFFPCLLPFQDPRGWSRACPKSRMISS